MRETNVFTKLERKTESQTEGKKEGTKERTKRKQERNLVCFMLETHPAATVSYLYAFKSS